MSILWIVLSLLLLYLGAELLVAGAAALGRAFGLSRLVIGLTIVAFGTSTPELAVSVSAASIDQADLAFGNVVGSNIFNTLVILGLAAIVAPLAVRSRIIRVDVPVLILISVLTLVAIQDGVVQPLEGAIAVVGLCFYALLQLHQGRKEANAAATSDDVADEGKARPTNLQATAMILGGLLLLILGAGWLVDSAVHVARSLEVGELVIALTIVAAGTSIPELTTSVVAGFRGELDIAVGNVIGSNVFNLLGVLGLSAAVSGKGLQAAPEAVTFDFPVLLACTIACLPIMVTGARISRLEGGLFLVGYGAYMALLIRRSVDPGFGSGLVDMLPWILIGVTSLALVPGLLAWIRRAS